ncbi:MAG: DUF167 domain-containing protein [Candidatus Babeliales bacterium]
MTLIIDIKVVPGAAKERYALDKQGALKWYVCAQPERGKANDALIAAMAKTLQCARSAITIISGATTRHKKVRIEHLNSYEQLLQELGLFDVVNQCRM